MNTLCRELKDHTEILKFFSALPRDLKIYTQSFYRSELPKLRCPCCQNLHYPIYCYHYCKRSCYVLALERLVLNEALYEYAFIQNSDSDFE